MGRTQYIKLLIVLMILVVKKFTMFFKQMKPDVNLNTIKRKKYITGAKQNIIIY